MSTLHAALLGALLVIGAPGARAEFLQLGVQDFSDGQILGCFSPNPGCSFGWTSPADPFNRFAGSDYNELIPDTLDFSTAWTFDLASLGPERPGSVRLEIGLYDHDSAAPGSQLASFVLNPGSGAPRDLTTQLDAALEVPGVGEQQEYNVIDLDLPPTVIDGLFASSVATFALSLKGPAMIGLKSGTIAHEGTNGAGLDFARLTLTYGAAPEPARALLCAIALAALAAARGRRG